MIREFFYLQKSDRKVILVLLSVVVIALGIIFLTGGENETSNALVSADSIDNSTPSKHHRDSFHKKPYHERTVYVRTKVVYRDTAYQRGHRLTDAEHDSVVAHYQPKIRRGEHIVLNTADTTALKTIPGIGSYFARKIVEYGERLGGYVSVDQLDEIEDFPLDAKRYLVKPTGIQSEVQELLKNSFASSYDLSRYDSVTPPLSPAEKLDLAISESIDQIDTVGADVGEKFRTDAIVSILVALGLMLLYIGIRFDTRYAPAAVISLTTTTLLTFGIVVVLHLEITLETVAAFLSLVGYGINDSIRLLPAILEKNGVRIAIFNDCAVIVENYASPISAPGIANVPISKLIVKISAFHRQNPDTKIVALLHWGHEFRDHPESSQRMQAAQILAAGADVIVGHHPHVIQDIDTIKGKTVYYSIGNFVFDQTNPKGRQALMPIITFKKDTVVHKVVEVEIVGNCPMVK